MTSDVTPLSYVTYLIIRVREINKLTIKDKSKKIDLKYKKKPIKT